MPFKTKKKKIKASLKSVTISQDGLASYKPINTVSKIKGGNPDLLLPEKHSISSGNYDFISKDILKILILASFIIGLQLILRLSNITF